MSRVSCRTLLHFPFQPLAGAAPWSLVPLGKSSTCSNKFITRMARKILDTQVWNLGQLRQALGILFLLRFACRLWSLRLCNNKKGWTEGCSQRQPKQLGRISWFGKEMSPNTCLTPVLLSSQTSSNTIELEVSKIIIKSWPWTCSADAWRPPQRCDPVATPAHGCTARCPRGLRQHR